MLSKVILIGRMKMLGNRADGAERQNTPPLPPAQQQTAAPMPKDDIDDDVPF